MDTKVSVVGRNGFIGSALAKRFETVYPYPHKDVKYLFFFGSPSSQEIFKSNSLYSVKETINGFINVLEFCKEHGVKLIYPSSATVYANNSQYAHTKSALEQIHLASGYENILGLRIFAGYGVGEENKGDYASIIYQFCKQAKNGETPVIWGNGTQSRDFVYIDDIVDTILNLKDRNGIYDIGTGVNTNFNDIIEMINSELGTDIKPKYVDQPSNYTRETKCENPTDFHVDVREGIKRICKSL